MTSVTEIIPSFINEIKEYDKTWKFLKSHIIAAKDDEKWLALCIVMRLSTREKLEEEKKLGSCGFMNLNWFKAYAEYPLTITELR